MPDSTATDPAIVLKPKRVSFELNVPQLVALLVAAVAVLGWADGRVADAKNHAEEQIATHAEHPHDGTATKLLLDAKLETVDAKLHGIDQKLDLLLKR